MLLNWINILHFYQPPNISQETVDEVVKSSYQSWADFLSKHKNVKVTINLTGCLTERLSNSGHEKLLKQFSKIAARKQIEFLESAAFHPILPLLPEKEIVRQIQINNQINKLCFGKFYRPKGFFLPEMAYSEKAARIIKRMGYKYILLDQISLNGTLKNKIDNNIKYKIKKIGLNVVFRNRKISRTFVPETIINILEGREKSIYVNQRSPVSNIITATDGELYGHRYWNWWPAYSYLTKTQKHKNTKTNINTATSPLTKELGKVITLTVSEYLKSLKQERIVQPVESSWESTSQELKKGIAYALWNHPKNKIHQKLWQLANFALQLNWGNQKDPNYFASRLHLENGLASCTFWWASKKDFKLLSPVAWHPDQVESGARELLSSIRSLEKIDAKFKIKAEKMFNQIRELVWQKHWRNNLP